MRALTPNSRTALEKMIREAGVKDLIAQPIIECLTQLGNELWSQRRLRALSAEDVQNSLKEELSRMKSLGPIHNPLLEMPGKCYSYPDRQ
jgi:hypothetical protein